MLRAEGRDETEEPMAAYDPELWHDFAIALVGAAGALCGLAFVAISFNLEAILKERWLPARAGETVVFLAAALIGGLLLVLPPQSNGRFGLVLLIFSVILALVVLRMDVPRFLAERKDPVAWQFTHVLPSLASIALVLGGSISVLAQSFGGLYWFTAGLIVLIVSGLSNCWVLLVEIKR